MTLVLVQLGLIAVWLRTLESCLTSVRVLHLRTICVLGYAWLACELRAPPTFLTLVCEWMVWIDVASIVLAVWNRDCRYFKNHLGGNQEA